MELITTFFTDVAASPWVLAVLFLACALDGVVPPIPGEVAVATVSTIAFVNGSPLLVPIVLAAISGAWVGDNVAFLLGRRLGWAPFAWMRRAPVARTSARIRSRLDAHPAGLLITARFIPVVRVLANIAAGASGMQHRRFVLLSAATATLWTSYTILIAVLAGTLVQTRPLLAASIAVVLAAATGYVVDRVSRARSRQVDRAART